MKIRNLMEKLAALNPEAEVWADGRGGWESEGPGPVERLMAGRLHKNTGSFMFPEDAYLIDPPREATPSDTLIVLSE